MDFHQFYLDCLAHASYLIGDAGVAAVVDPQRDVEQYLAEAERRGLAIRYVIETHLHADFVSGHCELARRTGARILVGRRAGAKYDHDPVGDGDEVAFGDVVLRFLETPGHTPEGITVLVYDRSAGMERPVKMLTGDTLFIGDVGRPDLVGSKGLTAEEMAGMMYDSLHQKILTFPDEVEVYPAHGAGSSCGKNISSARSSTLGEQRRTNYALQPMSREDFVRTVAAGLAPPPAYFPHDAEYNRRGAPALGELPPPPSLEPAEVLRRAREGTAVVDVRTNREYGAGHVPGSINVGLGGQFASWCGTLIDASRPIVLVASRPEQVAEARMRLARVGLENVVGALAGSPADWRAAGLELATVPQLEVGELRGRLGGADPSQVIDVRRPGEYEAGHVPGAHPAPLNELERHLEGLDRSRETAVICGSGYRSSAALSILTRAGFSRLANVLGGTGAWIEAGFDVDVPEGAAGSSCPSG